MTTRVPVAPSLLSWAKERSGKSDADFEDRFTSWPRWVAGEIEPTLKQVEDIARYSHLPFGVFFLEEPPTVVLPIPDYRLGEAGSAMRPSQDLLDVIGSSLSRQAWFRDYAKREGADSARIHAADTNSSVSGAARRIEHELGFTVAQRVPMSRSDARNHLRRRFEDLGGLPIFTSMVGNNTHRPLDRNEFRGFTLADDVAPLIFVNTNGDTLSGQIFTFLHEYAHVKLGESGIGHDDPLQTTSGVEGWCNAVAGEVLAPADDLRAHYRPDANLDGELERLAQRYICSTLVLLLRLRDLALIPRRGFAETYAAELERVLEILAIRERIDGGDFYRNQPFRVGEKFSRAVLSEVAAGRASFTDAFSLLGLRNAQQLGAYGQSLGLA